MIKGIDISHWQGDRGDIDWKKVKKNGYLFAFIKATESTNFLDPKYRDQVGGARDAGVLVGHYHFARGGDPIKEADFFLSQVINPIEGEAVILDWEIQHADPAKWCLTWLKRVEERLGFKPIIYLNESTVKSVDWTDVAKGNYGLWIAKYGNNDDVPDQSETPNTDEWAFFVAWQYTSRGAVPGVIGYVDINVGNFDSIDKLKKYGKQTEQNNNNAMGATKKFRESVKEVFRIDIGDNFNESEQDIVAGNILGMKEDLKKSQDAQNSLAHDNGILQGEVDRYKAIADNTKAMDGLVQFLKVIASKIGIKTNKQ